MKLTFPSVRAVMARRILVNFRVRPEVLQAMLPPPFFPKRIDGWGLAGICLIRIEQMRPAFLPAAFGVASENAAHRIAVEWQNGAVRQEGVFIPRRDTDSLLNRVAGGRLFPGVHHPARFRTWDTDQQFNVELWSRDGQVRVRVAARRTDRWPEGSLFDSLDRASAFLRRGCCGWSVGGNGGGLEGVELSTDCWEMHALAVDLVESSFFADETLFPPGTVEFDSALLMLGIPHAWQALKPGSLAINGNKRERPGRSALWEMP